MMRRIDAKISSIEGSWTFAGCVISDSTSSTPSHAFYTKHDEIWPVPDMQARDFHRTSPTCPQIKHRTIAARLRPAQGTEASRADSDARCGANCSAALRKVCQGNN